MVYFPTDPAAPAPRCPAGPRLGETLSDEDDRESSNARVTVSWFFGTLYPTSKSETGSERPRIRVSRTTQTRIYAARWTLRWESYRAALCRAYHAPDMVALGYGARATFEMIGPTGRDRARAAERAEILDKVDAAECRRRFVESAPFSPSAQERARARTPIPIQIEGTT